MRLHPKYYIYLSNTKVNMLFNQLSSKGFSFPEISPKISIPGFEATFNIQRPNDHPRQDTYTLADKVFTTMQKNEWVKPLLHDEPKMRFLNQDRDKWHSGIWGEKSHSEFEGAYINFKIHRDSLILLIGSSSHIVGYSDFDIHVDTSHPHQIGTGNLLHRLPDFIRQYEQVDNWWASKVAPFRIPPTLGYCISLSEICLKKFIDYPETELDIMFMIYQKLELRKAARELSREMSKESLDGLSSTRDWLERKISGTDMLRFRYLYIGSPIYTAL